MRIPTGAIEAWKDLQRPLSKKFAVVGWVLVITGLMLQGMFLEATGTMYLCLTPAKI